MLCNTEKQFQTWILYTHFSYFLLIFALSSNNQFFCLEVHQFTGDFKLLKMGWCLESPYVNMSVSPQYHTDLLRIIPQMAITDTIRVLITATIFLMVYYYNIEGQLSHNLSAIQLQQRLERIHDLTKCHVRVLFCLSFQNEINLELKKNIFFLYICAISIIVDFFISFSNHNCISFKNIIPS